LFVNFHSDDIEGLAILDSMVLMETEEGEVTLEKEAYEFMDKISCEKRLVEFFA
jgi:hypothetical protein